MEKPAYTFAPRGNQWAVLMWDYKESGASATTLCYFLDKQDAIKLAKHMNKTDHLYTEPVAE